MKIFHQVGHNGKWPLDSHFENNIGNGFIFNAFNFDSAVLGKSISNYTADKLLPKSMLDLQFYGNKLSQGGKLNTYPFHPINIDPKAETHVAVIESIKSAINFQIEKGFDSVIIPQVYENSLESGVTSQLIRGINKVVKATRIEGVKYYMTLPISGSQIKNEAEIEKLLQEVTDMAICFDGFYVVCESNLAVRKKVSTDFDYYSSLSKILETLSKQGFHTILGYANFDALVFTAMSNLEAVTIGTYENLRKFDIKRYTEESGGGLSDGWYWSEKLLNFVDSRELAVVRKFQAIDIIANDDNVFSDQILNEAYDWNSNKPDVHKNYLLSISRLLNEVATAGERSDKIDILTQKITLAKANYKLLESRGVILGDASSDYHLSMWLSTLNLPAR